MDVAYVSERGRTWVCIHDGEKTIMAFSSVVVPTDACHLLKASQRVRCLLVVVVIFVGSNCCKRLRRYCTQLFRSSPAVRTPLHQVSFFSDGPARIEKISPDQSRLKFNSPLHLSLDRNSNGCPTHSPGTWRRLASWIRHTQGLAWT